MSVATGNILLCSSSILSTNSDSHPHRLTTSRQFSSVSKRNEKQSLGRNHPFGDGVVDSFIMSSSNIDQSSTNIPHQDGQRFVSSPNKRYVSSFKTLVHSTSDGTENTSSISPLPNKNSSSPMIASTGFTNNSRRQPWLSSSRLSPVLKQEAQKRRLQNPDASSNGSNNNHLNLISNSTHSMATSTSSHSPSNPTLFTYRNSIVGGNSIRQRAFAETPTNNILITPERLKSNINSSMRPTRQPLATTTTTPSTYMSSPSQSQPSQPPQQQQQQQRNTSQNTRSRNQQDKSTNSKDIYEYPDPFTNCPQEFLSKLAQLTKLQLETIDWEKKRRFTKKKPMPNGVTQGKDSP